MLTIDQFKQSLKNYQHNYEVDIMKAGQTFSKCANDLFRRLSPEDRKTVTAEIEESNRQKNNEVR